MKKHLFMHGLRNTCVLAALLLPSALLAQDNYWLLDGYSYLNTATNAIAFSPIGPSSNANVRTVYNVLGNEVFTYAGGSSATQAGQQITTFIADKQQAFPIPGKCKQYYILGISNNSPHNAPVTLTKIDASGSGLPVEGSTTTLGNLSHSNYGAVAGKQDAGGNRHIYCLSNNPNATSTCYLLRYTIAANGNVGPQYRVDSFLPKCSENAKIKMAPDQNSLAYTDVSGNLVTYNFISRIYTSYGVPALGMAEANAGAVRRWYVSTGTALGYFVEGNTTFTSIHATKGTKSDIAQGKNGLLYVADGNPAAGTGTLMFFPSFGTSPVLTTVPGAPQIVGVNNIYTPTAYSFGNNVEGEDVNVSQTPVVSFTVNNTTGTALAPGVIWACPGMTSVPLNITVTGMHNSSYSYCYQFGTLVDSVFSGAGYANCFAGTNGVIVPYATYNTSVPVGSSLPHIKVDVTVVDVCGNSLTSTQYYEVKPVSLLVDFKLVGPSFTACNTSGLNRVTNISALASSINPQPATTPFCEDGWLGAASAGVMSGSYLPTGPITITSYSTTLEEVSPTGVVLGSPLATHAQPGPLYGYSFLSVAGPYFLTNYNTNINKYFKVTLSAVTTECGPISNYSYFRIINGGTQGNYWKPIPGSKNSNIQLTPVNVFPNPATDKVYLNWHNETVVEGKGLILFTDMLGKMVLQKELDQQKGNNDVILNIATLTPGIYHYKLITANGEFSGKLVKQ